MANEYPKGKSVISLGKESLLVYKMCKDLKSFVGLPFCHMCAPDANNLTYDNVLVIGKIRARNQLVQQPPHILAQTSEALDLSTRSLVHAEVQEAQNQVRERQRTCLICRAVIVHPDTGVVWNAVTGTPVPFIIERGVKYMRAPDGTSNGMRITDSGEFDWYNMDEVDELICDSDMPSTSTTAIEIQKLCMSSQKFIEEEMAKYEEEGE